MTDAAASSIQTNNVSALGARLLRLVLVDSLSPGRIVEMCLDGGAVLTGINGRGKTSYLQLLPLFYGESPSDIVKVNAGKDSFIDYYLPRTTSYICFEYSRPDGSLRLMICDSRGGEKLNYRFVRAGFDESMFKVSDTELVTAQNLKAHLKLSGVLFAERQIETITEYRAIIQGASFATSDRQRQREIKQLAQDYSFATSQQPLRQIEKIVTGMFRRETNFSDLQSMVVNCVSDGHAGIEGGSSSIAISQDRSKIEGWANDYHAYEAVMALAPRMTEVEEGESGLVAIDEALGEIRAKYVSLVAHFESDENATKAALERLTATRESEREDYETVRSELRDKHSDAARDAQVAESSAALLKQRFDRYEADGIQDKARSVDAYQNLQSSLSSLEKRKGILVGESVEIIAQYDQLKSNDVEKFNWAKDEARGKEKTLVAECENDLTSLELAKSQAVDAARGKAEVAGLTLETKLQKAVAKVALCEQAEKNPLPDPALVDLLEIKREALEDARQNIRQAEAEHSKLNISYLNIHGQFADQERKIGALERTRTTTNEYLEDCRRQLDPGAGTLLRFLRDECPATWSSSIAKVIRGDILERADLSPSITAPANGVFGLSLNLDYLDAHPAADVLVAQQTLERAQVDSTAATLAHQRATVELERIGTDLKAAESARDKQKRVVQTLEVAVNAADADRKAASTLVTKSKDEAKDRAKEQLLLARQTYNDADGAIRQHKSEIDRARMSIIETFDQRKGDRKCQRDIAIKALDDGLAQLELALQKKLDGYACDRDKALSERGVDTATLGAIDAEIKGIKEFIRKADSWRSEVYSWKLWCRDEWPKREQLLIDGNQLRIKQAEYAAELEAEAADWEIRSNELSISINKRNRELTSMRSSIETASKRISAMEARPVVVTPTYDPAWTLEMLSAQANKYLQQEQDLDAAVVRGVTDIYRGFKGRAPKQYIDQAIPASFPKPCREWVAPLSAWYADAHREFRRLLISESSLIAGEIRSFHKSMSAFHRRVSQFNRELQTGLDRSMAFESISHIGVEIISTIAEKEYWAVVDEMIQSREALSLGDASELPTPEFAQNVERLLGFWDVKTGIRADFHSLIRIQGEVVENGNRRFFKKASDLKEVSSNGLSYLVLTTIFIGFINRIRGDVRSVNITWALDELKDLSAGNVYQLLRLLERNNITLVSAFPDPDPDTLALFSHRYMVEPDRRLSSVIIDDDSLYTAPAPTEGLTHV